MAHMTTEPTYQHDCDSCRFLGHGPCTILAKMHGDPKQEFDFYVCEGGRSRSFIARYGNRGSDYMSTGLLECVELTTLDKVALYNGLELTPDENTRLLRVFASMWKDKFNVRDAMALSTGTGCVFGSGNIVWEDVWK